MTDHDSPAGPAADTHAVDAQGGAPVPDDVPRPDAASVPDDVSATGDPAVDGALSRLDELGQLEAREHVAVFTAIHEALQDRLVDAEQ